jgi:hypothetical protein
MCYFKFHGNLVIIQKLAEKLFFREMCLRFAELETKLGEIDRARAVYAHCSEVCDPRVSGLSIILSTLM